jgi:hypothetical protein
LSKVANIAKIASVFPTTPWNRCRRARSRQAIHTRLFAVAMAWFFGDEADANADSVAKSLKDAIAVVPGLLHLEIANILLVGARRKRKNRAQADSFLTRLAALPNVVDGRTASRA